MRVTGIDHAVRVEASGGTREVDLAGLTGAAAARLVALAANDLLVDDLGTSSSITVDRPAQARATQASSLGVTGGAAGWGGVLGDLALDLVVPRGAWVAALELGGGQLTNSALDLTAGLVRASIGVRTGPMEALELRAGLTAIPVLVSMGVGDHTVLVGAGASARLRLPVTGGVRGVLAVGLDAFATRTEYRITNMPSVTTPRWAPWIGAGVEVGL